MLINSPDQFYIDPDQLEMLEKRAKLNRFLPSFAFACFNGESSRETPFEAACTGDGGDDDLRLNMMDNALVGVVN